MDRDLNAACVILKRATGGHSGSNACNSILERDVAEATSVKQEALAYS
jgi:transposase